MLKPELDDEKSLTNPFFMSIYAKLGDLETMKKAYEKGIPWSYGTARCAVEKGFLDIIKWIKSVDYIYWKYEKDELCDAAVRSKSFEMLEYVLSIGCTPSYYTLDLAVKANDTQMVKYICEKLYYSDWAFCDITYSAVKNGNLEILKCLVAKGIKVDDKTIDYAKQSKNIDMLKWLRKNNCPIDY